MNWTRRLTPEQLQLRAQAIEAELDGLSIAELMRGRPFAEPPRTGDDARRYDPNQPRVPEGHPDGGQWTRGAGGRGTTPHALKSYAAARGRKKSVRYCAAQYAIDRLMCLPVEPERARACWAQANERWSACLSGRQIPPLNF